MKFLKKYLNYSISILSILFLPSCFQTYRLIENESSQGTEHKIDYRAVQENCHSLKVYDQWSTDATFDVVPMFDSMQEAYANLYCISHGKDRAFYNKYLEERMRENKQWFIMYVLADIRTYEHYLLTDDHCAWDIYIQALNGENIEPDIIEIITPTPEIEKMFGNRMSTFKIPYKLKFSRARLEQANVITKNQNENKAVVEPVPSIGKEEQLNQADTTTKDQNELKSCEKSDRCKNSSKEAPLKLVMNSINRECYLYWGLHPDLIDKAGKEVKSRVRIIKKRHPGRFTRDEYYYWV